MLCPGRGVSRPVSTPREMSKGCCRYSFDIDLPLEVDDEFWINDDPTLAFRQPPGQPAKVASFSCSIRLSQIEAFVLRTIVSLTGLR